MAIYFIEEIFYTTHTAGSKPRNDFNTILKSLNFESLQSKFQKDGPVLELNDIIFLQYTFTGTWKADLFEALNKKGIKVVLFINDIASLHDGNYDYIKSEMALFNKAAYIIIHNEEMKSWLVEYGVIVPLFCLDVFDYLISKDELAEIKKRKFSNEVIFAGNLNPSLRKFLYDPSFRHKFQLNLYGPEVKGNPENITTKYYGSFPPEQIPSKLKGSFALLWNGERQDTCSGHVGYYSTIARSHKTSLYLIAGLPLICWEKSSEATLVNREKIGFTINNLDEIDIKLANMSENEYQIMLQNVSKFPERLMEGHYMRQAITTIIDELI